ncbi:MAG: valine--tRNA ligase [Sphingomonadales bacterium 35-56-22]|jgi:valyl-tRNA synthetase|uniref:valine--tRNA ligase n=1 Tax=Sphingorhabdus sp. TaxID=1902408 RepID=UPI000BD90795|nr:valine--tRNA ligase [Sphingorhabdus sp.]OYY15130.1 MAG: valine--tRNA ligase [Sphingomonadales bacterium 35-56-22]OYY97394.1 MAG: valine--tRNA ligase [Sphingomonadales bacterium 28-56-43]OYZ60155.1 MAG: valine--tRNA ligase [Sphingomonadales bacterium 24-56-14]OZA82427.1 MAG: valine--tRNA ligase [Sphingomonadales bacterium 39-57-19]HQS13311.1 valine--tRNA ligase [Sphingorhabdus sp.]
MTIDKTFDPAAIEAKWYAHWESTGAFRPARPDAEPYTIVNPPPNVTGSLHIGHALDNTLQDILIRHARLQGKDALWVVGTDHAGIATQMVVERQLNARQQKRTDFTRDEFIAKVWEWKEESGGEITGQLRRLGCSMDWENERFTMDEGFSKAVIKVFVELYNQGLLYRDKRLVNWDPGLKTAISDLEVETREINGKFWHFKYPLEDGSGFISVATTRPETMLADMAVAVNPSDERYAHLVGKNVRLPITGRLIPIVADEHADPELGSGAVKVTPGHDFNDFEVGKRAGFKASEMFNMLDGEGRVVQTSDGLIPQEYIGQYRFGIEGEPTNARKMVVEAMDALGFLEKVEDRVIQTPFGDRSGQVIEPWLTDQWYVDAETLAKPAIEAVRSGAIDIVPKSWEKTYFNWMENIQPWCVSRQLWWGHQIPAWFDANGKCYVAETEEAAQALAGTDVELTRDPDVLDTWFSSALWPFGTLGWPDQTTELDRHYPNDVLVSGFDILFFWDARMAMQGIHFMKEVPWKTLYLHGLVRAADGSKMSKSKGNTVDPLGLIDQYGADALRFFMAAMESQGRDIKMDESRVAGYRNFATKLWNAARFAQSNGISGSHSIHAPKAELAVNRWIIGEVVGTVEKLNKAFAEFRFDGMADVIYHMVFDQFCDWYLELIKPAFVDGEKGEMDAESMVVAGWVLDQILVMLHPFMPFITEELWHALGDRPYDIIHAKWPEPNATVDADAVREIDWVIDTISKTRSFKAELNIPPGARLTANIADPQPSTIAIIERQAAALSRLGRIDSFAFAPVETNNVAQIVVGGDTVVYALDGIIDLDAERSRITKAIEAAAKERDALAGRLSNASFVEKAKPEAVEKARADHAEKAAEAERLTAALARLG